MSQDIYQKIADQEGVTRDFVKTIDSGMTYSVGRGSPTFEQQVKKLALQVRFAKSLTKAVKKDGSNG